VKPSVNPDYCDLVSALSDAGAEYLVVGALALAAHGHPRATGDIDLWVRPTAENADRVIAALKAFGAPLSEDTATDLATPDRVVQIGVAPQRVDILTSIDGVDFEEAWSARNDIVLEGVRIPVISRRHLIANKKASGRPRDLADVAELEAP
jgi:hypothetical protein